MFETYVEFHQFCFYVIFQMYFWKMLHLLMSIQLLLIKAETLTTQGIIDKKNYMPMCFCIYVILFITNFPYSILRKGIIIVQFSLISYLRKCSLTISPCHKSRNAFQFTLLPLNDRGIKLYSITLHFFFRFLSCWEQLLFWQLSCLF